MWDGELALSFEHFLDVNYGPVFLVYLLSACKALVSIDINTGAISTDTASSTTKKSLYLNVVRLLCVVIGFACHFGKTFNVMSARVTARKSESSGDGGSGGSGGSSGGGGGGGGGCSGSGSAVTATVGGYALGDDDEAVTHTQKLSSRSTEAYSEEEDLQRPQRSTPDTSDSAVYV
jgi:hypothetical protein